MKVFYVLAICLIANFNLQGQEFEWIFLEEGQVYGSCTSDTECATDQLCYGLQYTPSLTGTITSYTTGFFTTCLNGGNPIQSNASCIMSDASGSLADCGNSGAILLNSSGNSGVTAIVKDVPVMIHQLCVMLPTGSSIQLTEDVTTGLSVSIDSVNGGGPETDLPSFSTGTMTSFDCDPGCNGGICSRSFNATSGDFSIMNNAGVAIVDGSSVANSEIFTQSFDLYDEQAEDCGNAGGVADVALSFELINTEDANGNGIIDALGGANHRIVQTVDGISGFVPLGSSSESESSSGDYRGYEITVDFNSHLAIFADKLTVNLSGINTAGTAFESAVLIFNDAKDMPYGTATYNGYYNAVNDLTGNCMPTVSSLPWSFSGTGVFDARSTSTVDLTDPCNPVAGTSGSKNNSAVVPADVAGLNATDTIGSFTLRVILEDISAPEFLDDGSGMAPDDGIIANDNTNTVEMAQSILAGFDILGCPFAFVDPLPVELLSFEAKPVQKEVYLDWLAIVDQLEKFVVEWSMDGSGFTPIGNVFPNQSTSTLAENYQFIHKNPLKGRNYYRLRQLDLDGSFEYSEIRSADMISRETDELIVYPNPTDDYIYVDFPTDYENDGFEFKLLDISGRVIIDEKRPAGNFNFSLDLIDLPSAIYLLKVRTNQFIQTTKIIKQ